MRVLQIFVCYTFRKPKNEHNKKNQSYSFHPADAIFTINSHFCTCMHISCYQKKMPRKLCVARHMFRSADLVSRISKSVELHGKEVPNLVLCDAKMSRMTMCYPPHCGRSRIPPHKKFPVRIFLSQDSFSILLNAL